MRSTGKLNLAELRPPSIGRPDHSPRRSTSTDSPDRRVDRRMWSEFSMEGLAATTEMQRYLSLVAHMEFALLRSARGYA